MGFSTRQVHALRRDVKERDVRARHVNGRDLCYIEGWHAVAEANRIFGFDGWDRETVESRCVLTRETRGNFLAVYTAKVRITVRAEDKTIIREGHGSGEARGASPGETHDLALKTAETDATKRALATFGKPFGLSLYLGGRLKSRTENKMKQAEALSEQEVHPAPQYIKNVRSESITANASISELSSDPVAKLRIPQKQSVDKSVLTFGAARRVRNRAHLKFVASQPCLLCRRQPSDPHHLRFAQPQALGMKSSDEFTVPLCREHHRQLHHAGNELAWWHDMGIDPLEIAKALWEETQSTTAL